MSSELKICTKCTEKKEASEFDFYNKVKNKRRSWCKLCVSKYQKEYREKNSKILIQKTRKWEKENEEKVKQWRIEYQEKNIERKKQNQILFRKNNPDYDKLWMRNKIKKDENYRIRKNLRKRIWDALKENCKSKKTMELLDCNINYFKNHIQKLFKKNMEWDNYGEWHIDHILPCNEFDLKNSEEREICFHWTNLQPLWAKDNLKKASKLY